MILAPLGRLTNSITSLIAADANEDGLPITATLAGGTASGVVQIAIRYVVD